MQDTLFQCGDDATAVDANRKTDNCRAWVNVGCSYSIFRHFQDKPMKYNVMMSTIWVTIKH